MVSKIWAIFPFHVWDVILPIDELIFSRWLKPPIRWGLSMFFVSFGEGPLESHWPTRSNQYTGIRCFFHGSIAIIGYYQQLARFWWYPIFRQTHMLIEESRRYPSVCAVVDARVYSSQCALLVAKPLVCWGMSPKVRVDSSCLDQSLHKVTQNLYKIVGNTDDTNQHFHSAILQCIEFAAAGSSMEPHAIFSAYFWFCFWHFVRMLRSWQSTLFLHVSASDCDSAEWQLDTIGAWVSLLQVQQIGPPFGLSCWIWPVLDLILKHFDWERQQHMTVRVRKHIK